VSSDKCLVLIYLGQRAHTFFEQLSPTFNFQHSTFNSGEESFLLKRNPHQHISTLAHQQISTSAPFDPPTGGLRATHQHPSIRQPADSGRRISTLAH
jgi:hypothetical protein